MTALACCSSLPLVTARNEPVDGLPGLNWGVHSGTKAGCRLFDHTLVTSKIDQDAMFELPTLSGQGQRRKYLSYQMVSTWIISNPMTAKLRQDDTLVVSGKMSYHANISMVLHLVQTIMPLIWASQPGVKLWIVGKDPSTQIRSLAENPQITVTGTVDDIRPYLRQTAVSVSPVTYGVGIQNKVLEAMACGTPVVSTPQAISTLESFRGKMCWLLRARSICEPYPGTNW